MRYLAGPRLRPCRAPKLRVNVDNPSPALLASAVSSCGGDTVEKRESSLEHSLLPRVAFCLSLALSLGACSSAKYYLGFGPGDEANENVIDAPDPDQYVLVKNPQYSEVSGPGISPPPPKYLWVKRSKVPFTADALVRRQRVLEASPQEEAKWAAVKPPDPAEAPRTDDRFFVSRDQLNQSPRKTLPETARWAPGRPSDPGAPRWPVYGYVVRVRGKQIYTDLSAQSGVAVGSTVIIFREGEELKHPKTGASLGRADEEVARGRILEVGEQTSIAEVFEVKKGEEIRPEDKVKFIRAN